MNPRTLLTIVVAVGIYGCASTSGSRNETTPTATAASGAAHQPRMAMNSQNCPMQLPGTLVAASDIDGGVVITFRSTGDVTEVRSRVERMADMHNERHASAAKGMQTDDQDVVGAKRGAGAPMAGGRGAGMMMPPANASAENIEGGARLVLRPIDPTQLDALREHARMHAQKMAHGDCSMMSSDAQE